MRRSASVAAFLVAALIAPETALALNGEVTHLSGAVVARRADGGSRVLSMKSTVAEGDIVITADSSYARIKWSDGGEIVMRPGSQLKIDAYKYEEGNPQGDNIVLSLIKGGMRSVTGLLGRRNPGQFKIGTPNATIGIRGTHFGVLMCSNDCANVTAPGGGAPPNGLHVDVADGTIVVTTQAGSQDFRIGQFGFVQSATSVPVLVPEGQGTRVMLPPQALNRTILGTATGPGGDLECTFR